MEDHPKDLLDLFTANDATSKYFIHNIQKFNSIFSFTSIGGNVDKTVNNRGGPWIYRMQGENCHIMPILGPRGNDILKFSQLYIFDNKNEIQNRFTALREYNLPTANEVVAIIIGDLNDTGRTRDIIVEGTSGKPQHISELHPSYLPLQYPLLFPYIEDGYRDKIFLKGKIIETKKQKVETFNEGMVCL
uniref:Uncharacterized protein n=1 Tax=Tanacetum cinerariifolium TaxID=118510 RepID=A0A6L2N3K2_TANCI|nr:uncharacterized protein [Tanacetum cinerariifolium]